MEAAEGELDLHLPGPDPEDFEQVFGFGPLSPGLLRIPIILGIEALISGRILHDETPIWWTLTLWTLLLIPIMLSDDNLPKYYKIVFVYGIHSLVNLVDSFLLNLARPETRPIWGLIGWEAMKLEDFQYLVRIAFMLFNLIFFRGLISNILTDNKEEQWSWTSLLPFWISSTMIFGNFHWIGSSLLFVMRLLVLMKILMPIGKEIVTNTPQIYTQISTRVREENSNHLRVICRLVFDRVYDINPTPQVILQALLKSVIIKAMLHFISSLLQLNEKINPVINLSPQIENLHFTGMNSTGLALINMTAYSINVFTSTGYFSPSMFTSPESVILISTDSLLTVFSIAYFFSTPGEYLGLAIQRWLVNGQEPHDPHERGARMGQFLAMLHGFMALQTGITYMDEKGRLDRFDKNLWLIGIACMHYLHEMVEAELTNINDPRAVRRPIKAMGGLLLVAIVIDGHLILNHEISTWWIPVFVFTLELIIKATTSFAVFYMQKNDFNEDYIFWTKMGSKCCELIGGCIMLLNAIYVLIFQKPIMLVIRIVMMCIHVYFNIYRTFKRGREKIMLRLQTERQLDDLKEVNVEEIPEPDRLCAICYENFEGGIGAMPVIETDCQHRFHKQCIKKWLRLKNVCPLCHRQVFKSDRARGTNPENGDENAEGDVAAEDMNQNERNPFMINEDFDEIFDDLL